MADVIPISRPRREGSSRLPFVDVLRAFASNVIVWHHLAFYGPLSDIAYELAPVSIDFFYLYGRMIVAAFFVVGGFVTAQNIGQLGEFGGREAARFALRRYLRLGLPYLAVLVLVIAASAFGRRWMEHDSLSAFPTLPQLVAHLFFLHDVLGYESLSAGIWYLGIDFQLSLLLLFLTWASRWVARLSGPKSRVSGNGLRHLLCWLLALVSLFVFGIDRRWEAWGHYYFGTFFVGVLIQWVRAGNAKAWSWWVYVGAVTLSAMPPGRERMWVALGTGLLIHAGIVWGWLETWPSSRWCAFLGRISYSLFLVHFPVSLIVNAIGSVYLADSPRLALVGMLASYLLSLAAAIAFYRFVEMPCLRLAKSV